MMDGRCGETFVAGKQDSVKRLGKRNISGVIGGQIVPQIPDTPQQKIMRKALQRKRGEVREGFATALLIELAARSIPPDHLRDLHIDQMRRVQGLTGFENPFFDCVRRRRPQKHLDHCRGIDNDQRRSRSVRTASAGVTDKTTSERLAKRARNSSSVGRSAA